MTEVVRLSVSLEQSLLDKLEALIEGSGYANRSEFFRDMIRDRLVADEWERDEEAVGTITMVYDHNVRRLSEKLTDLQHDHHDCILAATHVHLSHDLCAEMIMARGQAKQIRAIADSLRQQKGVLHATLSMSSTGAKLG